MCKREHIEKWDELIVSRSSAYDDIREFWEESPEYDLSKMGAKEIAKVCDTNTEEEVRKEKLQTLKQEEAEYRILHLKNEKTGEEIDEITKRRARNLNTRSSSLKKSFRMRTVI